MVDPVQFNKYLDGRKDIRPEDVLGLPFETDEDEEC